MKVKESVCEVRTQDPENFDEEVLALVSAWCNALLTLHLQAYGQGELCSPALSPSAQVTCGHLAYHRAHRITIGEKVEGDRSSGAQPEKD